jgi:hypothetical protein
MRLYTIYYYITVRGTDGKWIGDRDREDDSSELISRSIDGLNRGGRSLEVSGRDTLNRGRRSSEVIGRGGLRGSRSSEVLEGESLADKQ